MGRDYQKKRFIYDKINFNIIKFCTENHLIRLSQLKTHTISMI